MDSRKTLEGRASDALVHFAQRDPPTFEAREVAEFLAVDSRTASKLVSTLVRRGWIVRHIRGLYEVAPLWASKETGYRPDRFSAIGKWASEPYYVGFRSAMEIRDWLDYPVRDKLWLAAPNSRHPPATVVDRVIWVVLRSDLFSWGRERHWVGSDTVWVSDPERTVLDGLHLPRHVGGISEVASVLVRVSTQLDTDRLLEHTQRYGIDAVARRLGSLIDTLGIYGSSAVSERLYAGLTSGRRSPVLLDPTLPRVGHLDRRWGVLVNVDGLTSAGRT